MKDLLMNVIRWGYRQNALTFKRNIANPSWGRSRADLQILAHGPDVTTARDDPRVLWIDDYTYGSTAKALWHGINLALFKGYRAIGFMDDDARFKFPVTGMSRLLWAVETCGAVGPMAEKRSWQKFKNRPGKKVHPLAEGWTTTGCQIYSVPFLQKARTPIHELLSAVKWWSDFPLFMIADHYGFKVGEVYVRGFLHKVSHTSMGWRKYDVEWYERRMRVLQHDSEVILRFFQGFDPGYMHTIRRLGAEALATTERLHKKWREFGTQWEAARR